MGINSFELKQNYPNPFDGTTTIEYTIPEMANVSLMVYDVTGKIVKSVISETQQKGTYKVNVSGLQRGIYLYQLNAGENKAVNKMIVR
jgi:hypothetical protein